MSYNAKVFNVMIASPNDVACERAIVREVVYEWNAIHSKSRSIVLLPISWESHSSPEMGSNPQNIIDNYVLDKCDILVGVFWTRLGTPTNEYDSGTVQEIEKHILSEKPVMLYFSSQPVAMDNVDFEQIKQLKEFKESCKNRGLYAEYDCHADFKTKFYHHLQLKLNEHPIFDDIGLHSSIDIIESQTPIPDLSYEAKILLKKASLDLDGNILFLQSIGGFAELHTNGENIISSSELREIAKWKNALKELVNNDLVEDRNYKGEEFDITHFGYQIADMIQL